MLKKLICLIITLCFSCYPVLAQDHDAVACNHNTGDCYDADIDLDFGVITVYLDDTNYKTLEVDSDNPDDITAYDKDSDIYYDIEIVK